MNHNIVLMGFMGTGKTAVGKELARRLNKKFIDTDEIIEKKEGISIPHIFGEKGEEYFREKETEAIKSASRLSGYVVSVGGGAVLREENIGVLRQMGPLVCLEAEPEVILKRIREDDERPLLGGWEDRQKRVTQLLKKRAPFYDQADIKVDTSHLTVSDTVGKIINMLSPTKLVVNLKQRSYPVFIGSCLDQVGELAQNIGLEGKVLVISDTNVFPLYGKRVENSLKEKGFEVKFLQISPGEKYKSLPQTRNIYDFCIQTGLDRSSSILGLGGGVVGDLAGFVAATFLRGINFFMVPTTLLSQVDSGVGGKVGVNLPQGKNLVGAFYQPKFVLMDPLLLRTLSERRVKEGLAEVIKCAIIEDEGFFSFLEENIQKALQKDVGILKSVIAKAVKAKIKVVQEDETEQKGVRQVLNLGHTIAHAIEKTSQYGKYTHGEAVAIGLVGAVRIANEMGIFSSGCCVRVHRLLQKAKLPTIAKGMDPQKIVEAFKVDKKIREGKLFFVLPEKIGKVRLTSNVPSCMVEKVVQELG